MMKYFYMILTSLILLSGCKSEDVAEMPLNGEAALTSFYFEGDFNQNAAANEEETGIDQRVEGEIDEQMHTVFVQFPIGGVDLTSLRASFETSFGAFVSVKGVVQESNITVNDFTEPVIYTVEAQNGTKVDYTVTVTNGLNNQTEVKYMYFKTDALDDETGLPVEDSIVMSVNSTNGTLIGSVKFEVDLTQMKPYFKLSPRAKLFIGDQEQISGENVVDFSSPVTYTVVAQDGTEQNYTAVLERQPASDENTLISFSFTKNDNPSLDASIEGNIDQELKTIELTVPEQFDLTTAVPSFEISPKASLKLGNTELIQGEAADFSSANELTVVAQNTAKTLTYTLDIKVMSMGNYMIDVSSVSGMDISKLASNGYKMDIKGTPAVFETFAIDYVNPGKVLSFKYKSTSAAKLEITLQGQGTKSGAVSQLYDLAATSAETVYSFDLSMMQRLFNWGSQSGTSFIMKILDAEGATIELNELKVRPYTEEEQEAADKVYYLNYTDDTPSNLSRFTNLTTCYAPDQLTYELVYTGTYDRTQAAVLAQIERDLTSDFSILEYEFYVEGSASDYQTLFTTFKFNTNVADSWSMAWNWDKGAVIGGQYGVWTLKTLDINNPSESWPRQEDGSVGNLPYYFGLDGNFGNKPQMYLSLGLLDGAAAGLPTEKRILIRGLRVRKP